MLENIGKIFKTVIELAEVRRKCEELDGFKEGHLSELFDFENFENSIRMGDEERRLYEYLDGLDFEEIKILQTIMYLGRDRDYNKNNSPEQIYKEQREYMDSLGWNEKHIEIDQMVGKIPLDQYLKTGLKILNITY